jgi:large subunit ribosomal protein L15
MQKHQIIRKTKNYKPATVGRGGKRGKTSGRGTKGQKARSGHKLRPELRDIIKRLPKIRGYGKHRNLGLKIKPMVFNLDLVSARFEKGETVSPVTLKEKGILRAFGGVLPKVKVLGDGNITKSLIFSNCAISNPARVKIEKAGGTIS